MWVATLTWLYLAAQVLGAANPQRAPTKPNAPRADTAASLKSTSWPPPLKIASDLEDVWKWHINRRRDTLSFKNFGWHQIMDNKGYLNYCIRWESTTPATAEIRKQIGVALNTQINKWFTLLAGFEGWPYPKVPIRIVGWAAQTRDMFPGLNETSEGKYYANKDRQGSPECAPACSRSAHQNGKYPDCPGGYDSHFDESFWLAPDNFGGGVAGDWGIKLQAKGSIIEMRKDQVATDWGYLMHEYAHTMGIPDFYEWKPANHPVFLMAGNGHVYITEFDGWLMRDWWRRIKPTIKNIPAPT